LIILNRKVISLWDNRVNTIEVLTTKPEDLDATEFEKQEQWTVNDIINFSAILKKHK
jgi:hypothetical protein